VSNSDLTTILLLLLLLVSLAQLLGHLFVKIRQPKVVGEILAGVVLGPALLGRLHVASMSLPELSKHHAPLLDFVYWMGLLLLMFLSGAETKQLFSREERREVGWLAIVGTGIPFAIGLACGPLLVGTAIAGPKGNKLSLIIILAVAVAVKVAEALERSHKARVPTLLYIEAALLLAAFAAVELRHPAHATDAAAVGGGMMAAAAMGMQNAMMRIELASLPSTTVMTMNVTQSVIDVVVLLSGNVEAARRTEARKRFSRMWPQILAFTAGAASGALCYALAGFAALLLPSALCLVLGLLWLR